MKSLQSICTLAILAMIANGCATIAGGSNYFAHVKVTDHPNAKISNAGMFEQVGNATFKIKRSDADKFIVVVREDGCAQQTIRFTQKTFRGWAFVGTIVTWSGVLASGVIIPYGMAVDLSTGALWKPSEGETGIMKIDSKNYFYSIDYKGCDSDKVTTQNNR